MSRANPRFRRVNPIGVPVGSTYGVVRYVIQGLFQAQMTINVFDYFAAIPGPGQAALATLLTNISANILSAFRTCVGTDWAVTVEKLTPIHRNDLSGVISTAHTGQAGTGGSASADSELAIVLLKHSALKGQHGRGRTSLPAVPAGGITQSNVTLAGLLTNLGSLAVDMGIAASDGANNWLPCISTRSTASPRLVTSFAGITVVTVNGLLGTIRRRKIGRGK